MAGVRRTWLLVLAIAAGATGASLLVTALVGRVRPERVRPPPLALPPLPVDRLDAHQHVDAGAVDQALQLAAGHGIRGFLNVAGGWAGDGLEGQLAAAARQDGRVRVVMTADPEGCCGPEWGAREAERIGRGEAAGAAGLDLGAPLLERAPLDGPELAPLLDACERLGLPVSLHLGGPDQRAALERLAARRPALRLVAAHLAGPGSDAAEASRLLSRIPNLALDLSARLADLSAGGEEARALLLEHADRVLFGTNLHVERRARGEVMIVGAGRTAAEVRDFFRAHLRFLESRDADIPLPGAGDLRGLGLPREVLERLYHRNAERLYGFRPEER
jgi:predicted TIM-barrel fold metal-dependent hydrolase